jgi:phosphoribosyl 1,2-cyclic phosphate phosphodiesterase
MKLTILGCGASGGVPIIGCGCKVCGSNNPKNKRSRASVLFENDNGKKLLIDASPDLRAQALNNNISNIDALLITHAHADHCHGIDDIRPFNFHKNAPIDLYANSYTMEELQERFAYVFKPHQPQYGWYKPAFNTHIVELPNGITQLQIAEMNVTLFAQTHGGLETLGVRIGDIAYSTDVNHLPQSAFNALEGVKIWVVDCLRPSKAPTHAHLELTLSWIERVKPEQAFLTHMAHEFDYDELCASLPKHIRPAYDGMVLSERDF